MRYGYEAAKQIGVYDPDTQKIVPKDAVVLDLAAANDAIDPSEVAWAAIKALRESPYLSDSGLADQIEAQTKPPRVPEPPLYSVVEAGPEWSRRKWVRGPKGWTNVDADGRYLNWSHWDSLENPRLAGV